RTSSSSSTRRPPTSTLFPYTTLFRSQALRLRGGVVGLAVGQHPEVADGPGDRPGDRAAGDHPAPAPSATSPAPAPCARERGEERPQRREARQGSGGAKVDVHPASPPQPAGDSTRDGGNAPRRGRRPSRG